MWANGSDGARRRYPIVVNHIEKLLGRTAPNWATDFLSPRCLVRKGGRSIRSRPNDTGSRSE